MITQEQQKLRVFLHHIVLFMSNSKTATETESIDDGSTRRNSKKKKLIAYYALNNQLHVCELKIECTRDV